MKCEKCGNNEAVYYYRETVNGKTTEKHMCADCAREEGLDRAFEDHMGSMWNEFDREMESFFSEPFFEPLLGRRGGVMSLLAPRFTLPRIEIGFTQPKEKEAEHTEENANPETSQEDGAMARKRELNELRSKLDKAVKSENYEEAITLRDKIRDLEKKG